MNIRKSSLGLKLISLAFPMLLSGCHFNNPYTIKIMDLNKDGLQDIAITDSVGRDTAEYIQVNGGEYINSPFHNEHEIKIREGITKSFFYTPYKIKIMDLNKDSLQDIVIIHTNIIEKYLQRKDGKYIKSVEERDSHTYNKSDDLLPIEIWAISPGGLLYPSQ